MSETHTGIEAIPSKINLFRSLTNRNVDHTRLYIQELCMLLVEFKRFWSFVKTVWSKSYESHLGAIYFFSCLLKIASDYMCEGKFQPCLRPMWDEEWGPMCSMCKLSGNWVIVFRGAGDSDTDYARMWLQWPQPVPGGSHDLCWHRPGDKIGARLKLETV